jgi:hypothetical protein
VFGRRGEDGQAVGLVLPRVTVVSQGQHRLEQLARGFDAEGGLGVIDDTFGEVAEPDRSLHCSGAVPRSGNEDTQRWSTMGCQMDDVVGVDDVNGRYRGT